MQGNHVLVLEEENGVLCTPYAGLPPAEHPVNKRGNLETRVTASRSLWQVEHDLATEAPLAIPVYDLSPRPDEPTNWPQSLIGRFMRNRRVPAGLDRKGLGSGIDDSPPTTVL